MSGTNISLDSEAAIAQIFSRWQDNDKAGLSDAGFRLGQLVSASLLSHSKAHKLIDEQDKPWWPNREEKAA